MCIKQNLEVPKVKKEEIHSLSYSLSSDPPRVPPLPILSGHMMVKPSNGIALSVPTERKGHGKSHHSNERAKQQGEEELRIQALLEADGSNYTTIVVEDASEAGTSKKMSESLQKYKVVLERIDQELLELGPFAKDTYQTTPKEEVTTPVLGSNQGYHPLASPPYTPQQSISQPSSSSNRRGRRGGRLSSGHGQGAAGRGASGKKNSRSSENGPVSRTMSDEKLDSGSSSRASSAGAESKSTTNKQHQHPRSKWKKVGSAGTVRGSVQRKSSDLSLQPARLKSPGSSTGQTAAVPTTSEQTPSTSTASKKQSSSSLPSFSDPTLSSPTIIPAASEIEMQGLFFNHDQWGAIDSPPSQAGDAQKVVHTMTSSTVAQHHGTATSLEELTEKEGTNRMSEPAKVQVQAVVSTGTASNWASPLTTSVTRPAHPNVQVPASSVTRSEVSAREKTSPNSSQYERIKLEARLSSRSDSHSSNVSDFHTTHSQAHVTSELALHLASSSTETSRPGFQVYTFPNPRDPHSTSPLVTTSTLASDGRSQTPESHKTPLRFSEVPSPQAIDVGGPVDKKRRSSSSSSYKSNRHSSFDETGSSSSSFVRQLGHSRQQSGMHISQRQSASPLSASQQSATHVQDSTTPGIPGVDSSKFGGVNPYVLWANSGQVPPTGTNSSGDPTTSTLPRYPYPTPFMAGTGWLQTPGGMIAAAGLPTPFRPPMLPVDPSLTYKTALFGSPFLQYRYPFPPGINAFSTASASSLNGSTLSFSQTGTPAATVGLPGSLYPLSSSPNISGFRPYNESPGPSSQSSSVTPLPQQFIPVSGLTMSSNRDDKQPSSDSTLPDKASTLNWMQAAQPVIGSGFNVVPFLGVTPTQFGLGGVSAPLTPNSLPQQVSGMNLFTTHLATPPLPSTSLSGLASSSIHTGSDGNLHTVGMSMDHKLPQRRRSSTSIDVTTIPPREAVTRPQEMNQSPTNVVPAQKKPQFPLGSTEVGGKWKALPDGAQPVTQFIVPPPYNIPAGSIIDARSSPMSGHMFTNHPQLANHMTLAAAAGGSMIPLAGFIPPPNQLSPMQRERGSGTESRGRSSRGGSENKMKLRIHQVKNDDFKAQNKPDRRRKRYRAREVISVPEPDATLKQSSPPMLKRVRSDSSKQSSTISTDGVHQVLVENVSGRSEPVDSNYALNMLATMSTMQSREQDKPVSENLSDLSKRNSSSPLTISATHYQPPPTSTADLSHRPQIRSPVSLAGAKSLLLLGKDVQVHEGEETKGGDAGKRLSSASNNEVSHVESSAVDSLLQLSGAVPRGSSGKHDEKKIDVDMIEDLPPSKETFVVQGRETRSASYSAAEAMLMMVTSDNKVGGASDTTPSSGGVIAKQPSSEDVFENSQHVKQAKQVQFADNEMFNAKLTKSSLEALQSLSQDLSTGIKLKKPEILRMDSEATDTDSEATLTPQSPSCVEVRLGFPVEDELHEPTLNVDGDASSTGMEQEHISVERPLQSDSKDNNEQCMTSSNDSKTDSDEGMIEKDTQLSKQAAEIDEHPVPLTDCESATVDDAEKIGTVGVSIEEALTDASKSPFGGVNIQRDNSSPVAEHGSTQVQSEPVVEQSSMNVSTPPSTNATQSPPHPSQMSPVQPESPHLSPDVVDKDKDFNIPVAKRQKFTPESEVEAPSTSVFDQPAVPEENEDTSQVDISDDPLASEPGTREQEEAQRGQITLASNPAADQETTEDENGIVKQSRSSPLPSATHSGEISNTSDLKSDATGPSKPVKSSAARLPSWSAFASEFTSASEKKSDETMSDEKNEEFTAATSPVNSSPPHDSEETEATSASEKTSPHFQHQQSPTTPFTPDPPIELQTFDMFPPSPKTVQQPSLALTENETTIEDCTLPQETSSSPKCTSVSDATSIDSETMTSSQKGFQSSPIVAPQNRLVVAKHGPDRFQRRKHLSAHAIKRRNDSKREERLSNKKLKQHHEIQPKSKGLFEVDSPPPPPLPLSSGLTQLKDVRRERTEKRSHERISKEEHFREAGHARKLKPPTPKQLLGHGHMTSSGSGHQQRQYSKHGSVTHLHPRQVPHPSDDPQSYRHTNRVPDHHRSQQDSRSHSREPSRESSRPRSRPPSRHSNRASPVSSAHPYSPSRRDRLSPGSDEDMFQRSSMNSRHAPAPAPPTSFDVHKKWTNSNEASQAHPAKERNHSKHSSHGKPHKKYRDEGTPYSRKSEKSLHQASSRGTTPERKRHHLQRPLIRDTTGLLEPSSMKVDARDSTTLSKGDLRRRSYESISDEELGFESNRIVREEPQRYEHVLDHRSLGVTSWGTRKDRKRCLSDSESLNDTELHLESQSISRPVVTKHKKHNYTGSGNRGHREKWRITEDSSSSGSKPKHSHHKH